MFSMSYLFYMSSLLLESFVVLKYPNYILGDLRVNEQPTLGTMHLIFLREHNRLARSLKEINPHWNDETLYQVNTLIITNPAVVAWW